MHDTLQSQQGWRIVMVTQDFWGDDLPSGASTSPPCPPKKMVSVQELKTELEKIPGMKEAISAETERLRQTSNDTK